MATLTLEYNPRSSFAKALIGLIQVSDKVRIVDSTYDPNFVEKIQKSEKSGKRVVNLDHLWD